VYLSRLNMKRSIGNNGDSSSSSSSNNNNNNQSKKQKVANNNNQEPEPQPHLMPCIPAVPPVAPPPQASAADSKRPKTLREYHNISVAKVYAAKDYELWPTIAVNVYRAQINIHNRQYASDMIRYWFDEHQGLRTPPPKSPRSAYTMFFSEQKSWWFQQHGKWNNKKDGKKIGALWKELGKDEKNTYQVQYDKVVAQYDTNEAYWQNQVVEWRREKLNRLESSGEEMNPEKRIALKLNSFCQCKLCKSEEEEEEED
jgi:hypothetical protein